MPCRIPGRCLLLALLLTAPIPAIGCHDDTSTAPKPAATLAGPTYHADVAPILRNHCVSCHQADGVARFPLTRYEDARARAGAIVSATSMRAMPPWRPTADGSCQTFRDFKWLSTEELATLEKWVAAGMPAGDAGRDPGPAPGPAHLGADALGVTMPEAYTPRFSASKRDDYRCVVLDPKLASPAFVTATEILPGAIEEVHHVGVYAVDPNGQQGPFTNGQAIERLAAADPEVGWSCFGALGDGVVPRALLTGWAPGTGLEELPPGVGLPLAAGDLLVLQMHYRAHEGAHPEPDRTTVRLRLASAVQKRAVSVFLDPLLVSAFTGMPHTLAAGAAEVPYHWEVTLGELLAQVPGPPATGIEIIGVYPHMHTLGTKYQFSIEPPSTPPVCGLDIGKWDFAWQRSYLYKDALAITDRATRLRVTCSYDTRGLASPVQPGHDEGQEMCSLILHLVPTY